MSRERNAYEIDRRTLVKVTDDGRRGAGGTRFVPSRSAGAQRPLRCPRCRRCQMGRLLSGKG